MHTYTAKSLQRLLSLLFLCLLAALAQAQNVSSIRIGVATGGVGNPPRTGSSALGIANAQGLLEKEFEKDGIKIDWIFFKGAGPAVNEALGNKQLDLAWQGDL